MATGSAAGGYFSGRFRYVGRNARHGTRLARAVGHRGKALMVTLRLIQGFCLGGELPGALTYVGETTPRLAPLVCSVVFACVTAGGPLRQPRALPFAWCFLPSSFRSTAGASRSSSEAWGACWSFMLRRSLEESPEFARMRALAARRPFRELLRTHAAQVLVGCAVLAGTACFTGLFFSHPPAHLGAVPRHDPRRRHAARRLPFWRMRPAFLVGWIGERIPPRYLLRAGDCDPALLVPVLCSSTLAR